jgi:hypothetical protein
VDIPRRLAASLSCALLVGAVVVAAAPGGAQERPALLPTRDVDITYDVTRPQQPQIRERVRWLADERLERVDGRDKSPTIFDHNAHAITLLNPKARTFRKLEGAPRRQFEPGPDAVLKRGNESTIAGLKCVDWSWTEEAETHTVCATPDGALLRLVVDGSTIRQARSVNYGRQAADLFEVPRGYSPALAPGGDTGF